MRRMLNKKLGTSLAPVCVLAATAFLSACSSSDDKDVSGGASGDMGVVTIADKELAGVAQKGPFVKGSNVVLKETAADGSLELTGREYNTTITGDKGEFTITDIDLECQYVLLSAEGYYTREIVEEFRGFLTDEEYEEMKSSRCPMRLDAVTDLAKRKSANINVLTHFEYKRVLNLVKSGKSFAEAKRQALTEVFAAFGVDIDAPLAEGLNIFNTTEGDRTLYYISVFIDDERWWGKFDCSGLQEFIDGIADDFADDGALSDDAMQYLASVAYGYIRENVEAESYDEKSMKEKEKADPGSYDFLVNKKKEYEFGKALFLNYMGVEQCTEDLKDESRKFEKPIAWHDDNGRMVILDSGFLLCDGTSWKISENEKELKKGERK